MSKKGYKLKTKNKKNITKFGSSVTTTAHDTMNYEN
jgi:hypothetical protein